MSFKNLSLRKELLQAIEDKGYTEATPIQIQAIPMILRGEDLLAGAQTGTGKTAGFTLPLLQRLMEGHRGDVKGRKVRGLILAPTRELAAQITDSVMTYGKHLPLKAQAVFGGVNMQNQIKKLRQGADILIATPGRLLDLVSQKVVDLRHVEIFILDEADRMMDMGFIPDIRKIMAVMPQNRQNLLFSATFSKEIKQLAQSFLKAPQTIEIAPHNTPTDLVSQIVYPVDSRRKRELLSFLIRSQEWKQVLVFTRTKHAANRLAEQLRDDGIPADAIHGNKSQGARMSALRAFKSGSVRVLVATDIVSRGLDIDQLPHVVNFELPPVPEDYVHRIGRTGRAGNTGKAYSLVCIDERRMLSDIERLLKQKIPAEVISGYEPDPSIRAEPIRLGRRHYGPRPPSSQKKFHPKKGGRPQQPQHGKYRKEIRSR
ncbi:MAG: DEAD/DEAH box helicase [Verrucomicrobia bacterium]|nr:DEAD/DEAH box helicase [Verrucomicrobiota bacterium]MBU6446316.1 DEAD/DEAH box helicase [Verrucomicrobiota bacterium]MDE3048056.1 DEAD/DEAH box helicase [Verrucomicrobiota bacterium]